MRISTKCSIAIHCLVLIALLADKHKVTSELLALSTGSNAVIIRNIMGALKKAGIISISKGNEGTRLILEPKDINVWLVYSALEAQPFKELFGLHPAPNPKCPVGANIYHLLAESYEQIGNAMEKAMRAISLKSIMQNFKQN